jgi:hypothetical protein
VRLVEEDAVAEQGEAGEPPRIFRTENQLRLFLFWKEMGIGDGKAAQVVYA